MKKQITLFFLILVTFVSVFAQNSFEEKMVLIWDETNQLITSKNNSLQVPLLSDQFVDDNQLPLYSKTWTANDKVSVVNYTITNIQYQTISTSNYKDLNDDVIPTRLKTEFRKVSARNDTSLLFTMIPLVKNGGVIRKVISFTLNYELGVNNTLVKKAFGTKQLFNSVLSTGDWYKFAVDTTGVFKINRSFLQSLGINTNSINPKNIKIYGNGGKMLPQLNSDFRYDGLQENAIFVSGEEDGKFDTSDYILFYAQGSDSWSNDTSNSSIRHKKNIYADQAIYFITVGGSTGKRIVNEEPNTNTPTQQISVFNDFTFHEKEDVNLFTIGQQWFGEDFSFEDTQSFTLPFNDIDANSQITIRVRGVVESSLTSSMTIKANGSELFNINYPAVALGSLTHAYARENKAEIALTGNGVTVEVIFNNGGNPSAKARLDYIEVIGTKTLTANGSQFGFRNFDVANSSGIVQYQIQNSNNISEVWEVTDLINPVRLSNQSAGSSYDFNANAGTLKQYQVLNELDFYTPTKLDNPIVANQNLHSLQDIDYVIVTQDYLINQVEDLAEYHRRNGLTVEIVDLEKIYNEFSSGNPDLTAIRDFTKHLYDNATTTDHKIKYLCLFGDASYDYKDRIVGNNNIVPVFEAFDSFNLANSYVTDDYYGMMDPNEGLLTAHDRQDVITGRIPVTDIQQASEVIAKIMNYYSTNGLGDWRNSVTLIADDIDARGEGILQENMEKIADSITDRRPVLNIKKIYADAYVQEISSGGERYPDVNNEISNNVERGTLLIDYFGHGGEDGWASERILEVPQIRGWNNFNRLPLLITITCEFTKFDNPLRLTAGEYVVWNKKGGAVSLITTTREIFISVGREINERLIKYLLSFNGEDYTIAEAIMHVKNTFTTNQRLFIYPIGDPAMKLAVPKADVKITHMNGVDVTQSLDTIKALSHVSFDGIVTNSSGGILNDFNGEVSTIVFDKAINKSTLDNDNFGIIMDFDAIESKIFRGRAKVVDGKFSFDFIAPKDLRIAFGKGKLSFYADDKVREKSGYNFDVVIGGINENAPEDSTGPEIQLFMNDESFVDGGNTNESPILVVVLEDESGINTSITAVDHDIVAVLDGDQANPFILNDYYQTELNDFTKGKAEFPFRNLEPGLHTIELCAWDTYNNTSCATLTFIVVSNTEMVLDNVLNYPNPFVNYTEFWFNHNKPNEPLEVQVQIFTVSGKLVKTLNQIVQSTGNLSRSVTWDGLDDFGDKIGKGVYVYKLNVKSTLSNVKAEKYEKLVILQ